MNGHIIILELKRWRQEERQKFKVILSHMVRSGHKATKHYHFFRHSYEAARLPASSIKGFLQWKCG